MKVLVLTPDFLPNAGGIAVFLHNLCSQLVRLDHQVYVLAPRRASSPEIDLRQPYQVRRYDLSRRLSSVAPLRLTAETYHRHRHDVVLIGSFMTTHALGALLLRGLWQVPYVVLSHGNDLRYSVTTRVDGAVARLLMSHASLMLGNSRFTSDLIRQAGHQERVEVLSPGVDVMAFHPGVDTTWVRRRYGLDGRRVVLTTARLTAKKNVDGVLRALPQVIARAPDVLYLVIGDGEERGRLEALCDELGLRPSVRFLGYVENRELPALYCAADLFVMPSLRVEGSGDTETFGISFLEASACGKPVVGGWSGGTADAVIDGETGLLVDPHDVDAIAGAILRLLGDPELAAELGENGRRRVECEFSWEKVGSRLVGVLQDHGIVRNGPEKSV